MWFCCFLNAQFVIHSIDLSSLNYVFGCCPALTAEVRDEFVLLNLPSLFVHQMQYLRPHWLEFDETVGTLGGIFWHFQNDDAQPTAGTAITGQNKVTCLPPTASERECNICGGQMLQSAVALSLFVIFFPKSSHGVMHPTVIICSRHFKPHSKLKHCVLACAGVRSVWKC